MLRRSQLRAVSLSLVLVGVDERGSGGASDLTKVIVVGLRIRRRVVGR